MLAVYLTKWNRQSGHLYFTDLKLLDGHLQKLETKMLDEDVAFYFLFNFSLLLLILFYGFSS